MEITNITEDAYLQLVAAIVKSATVEFIKARKRYNKTKRKKSSKRRYNESLKNYKKYLGWIEYFNIDVDYMIKYSIDIADNNKEFSSNIMFVRSDAIYIKQ